MAGMLGIMELSRARSTFYINTTKDVTSDYGKEFFLREKQNRTHCPQCNTVIVSRRKNGVLHCPYCHADNE